jgi:FHS family L-fucose permease-like MFS transporter
LPGPFSATAYEIHTPRKTDGHLRSHQHYPVLIAVYSRLGGCGDFLTSFFMSLMFPTIFALGIKGLGENIKLGGSLMVMAIIGGAVFTPIMGLIADKKGSIALAMMLPLICYVVVTWYAISASKIKTQ